MAKTKNNSHLNDEELAKLNGADIKQIIKISCSYTALIPLSELIPTQGSLKVSKGESLTKLEKSFIKHGFIKPLVLWWDTKKDVATTKMLDGHQRRELLIKLASVGTGTENLMIPVIYSKAPTYKQAMEILLHLIEQTGDITQKGLLDFATKNKMNLDDISARVSLKTPALSQAKKALEDKRVAKMQENPKYPIQPFFSEKYGAAVIFYKTEMDELWLRNFLKMEKTKDYNSTSVGQTNVMNVEQFQQIVEDFEDSLRPARDEDLSKEDLEAKISSLKAILKTKK